MNRFEPLFDSSVPSVWSSVAGVANARFCQLTDSARHIYGQIFAIFDRLGLEYYVFAGAMVGYVRNGRLPPWADDVDVMVIGDQCEYFEREVVPYLVRCGFHVARPLGFDGGGVHVFAGTHTVETERYRLAPGIEVPIPWAQVDVFFSSVDADGFVRNRGSAAWGLYHGKDVPVDWIAPGTVVEVDGLRLRAFSEFAKDIAHEYGDVLNNLLIHTHTQTFLRIESVPWAELEAEFNELYFAAPSRLPPGVTSEAVSRYSGVEGRVLSPAGSDSLACIVRNVLACDAGTVVLKGWHHIIWSMDVKRIVPGVRIVAQLDSLPCIALAAHLRRYIDDVESHFRGMLREYRMQASMLDAVVGR